MRCEHCIIITAQLHNFKERASQHPLTCYRANRELNFTNGPLCHLLNISNASSPPSGHLFPCFSLFSPLCLSLLSFSAAVIVLRDRAAHFSTYTHTSLHSTGRKMGFMGTCWPLSSLAEHTHTDIDAPGLGERQRERGKKADGGGGGGGRREGGKRSNQNLWACVIAVVPCVFVRHPLLGLMSLS